MTATNCRRAVPPSPYTAPCMRRDWLPQRVAQPLRGLGRAAALYEGALRALATIAPPVREWMAAYAMREVLDELELAARVGSNTPGLGVRADALAECWRPTRTADDTVEVTQAMIS